MLERLLVALLTGGHVLLEGVPGLAKTLTVRTLATVLGGTLQPHPVHPRPRAGRPRRHAHLAARRRHASAPSSARCSPTSCSPTRSTARPAKVQSALLEVMQEHQVTIGGETHRVPEPFLVLATQNPIESEGTYDLPEAQVDRFLFKLVVDYPAVEDEIAVVDRVSVEMPQRRAARSTSRTCSSYQQAAREVFADRSIDRLRRRARRRDPPPGRATGSPTSSR